MICGFVSATPFSSLVWRYSQKTPNSCVTKLQKNFRRVNTQLCKTTLVAVDKSSPSTSNVGKTEESKPFQRTTTGEEASTLKQSFSSIPSVQNSWLSDPTKFNSKVQDVAQDILNRPVFYAQLLAATVGIIIAIDILDAVVIALDRLPLLPSIFELVGLGYSGWFIWRYALFSGSRQELKSKLDSFIGKATNKK
ncbi:protein curvature thylakoid 1a, chloroplastic [Galdieria sulphuraria]|uniref:Cyanobacterial aminoacyl-tRNA synthetase CAAD domain-containing protein n=1 Tax=Galdieria sulphuraria TaxID=130081 RepID=M2XYK7_GALSU|nr:uncharacterized protein Gasu_37840 [Galdieria sulphuraria]EME28733.1 hypothetical protein Gasu_37840 [Galdieria sulphuraria]GJD07077.1 protein curvature thylakoid 1a, chloroplastic [Galdieria sulphuraria]|eukprot:XP_005705253.1 hypothetical protein Gasu_37840 [Galdieria sulphuraria]